MGVQEGGWSGGDGEKTEWKSSEVNTRAVSTGQNESVSSGQNEFIGKFKMVTGNVISIKG